MIHAFVSIGSFCVGGRQCYVVKNPIECSDFSHLIGKQVTINLVHKVVLSVERKTHAPPFRKGEVISLMVACD